MLKKSAPALVCGLGNPSSYSGTRHNVGKQLLDFLSQSFTKAPFGYYCPYEGHYLVKPDGFMNLVGTPIREAVRKFALTSGHLVLVQDDIDQALGKIKVKRGGSANGHNGVLSVINVFRSDDFPRLKIGVGRPANKEDVAEYVLSPFSRGIEYPEERELLHESVFPQCKLKLLQLLSEYESSEEQFLPLSDVFVRLQLHDPSYGLSLEQVAVWRGVYGPNVSRSASESLSLAFFLLDAAIFLGLVGCYIAVTANYSQLSTVLLVVLFAVRGRFIYSFLVYSARTRPKPKSIVSVTRAGRKLNVDSEELVPGDVIHLSAGDRVPADVRLIHTNACKIVDLSTLQEGLKNEDTMPRSPLIAAESYVEAESYVSEGVCTAVVIRIGAAVAPRPQDPTENVIQTALTLSKGLCVLTILAWVALLLCDKEVSPPRLTLMVLAMYEACVPHSFVGQLCLMANRTFDLLKNSSVLVRENKTLFALGDANCICVEAEDILTNFEYEITSAVVDLEPRQFENPSVEFFNGSSLSYLRILLSGALTTDQESSACGLQNGLTKAFKQAQSAGNLLEKYQLIERTAFQIDEVNHAIARTPDPATCLLALSGPFPLVFRMCKFALRSGHATEILSEMGESLLELHHTLQSQGVMTRSFAYAEVPRRLLEEQWKWEDVPLVYAGSLGLEPRILEGVPEAIAECRLNSMHVLLLTAIPLPQATSVALKSNILTGVSSIQATCVTYADLTRLPSKAMVKDLLLKPELVLAEVDLPGKSSVLARLRALGNVPVTVGFKAKHAGTLAFVYQSSPKVAQETADVVVLDQSLRAVLMATHASQHLADSARKLFLQGFSSWAPEAAPFVAMAFGLPLPLSLALLVVQKVLKETLAMIAVANSSPEPVRAKVKLFSGRTQFFALCLMPLLYVGIPFLAYFVVMAQHGFNPQRLMFLGLGAEPADTDVYNPALTNHGNSHAGDSVYERYFDWSGSTAYDMRLWFYAEDSWLPCYVSSNCYSSEAIKIAQTAYFLSLATQTVFTALTIRSIISSMIRTRCRPVLVQVAIIVYAAAAVAAVYTPWLNSAIDTRPLPWDLFVVATVPGAALTVAQLEFYKWRLRSRS